MKFTSPQYITIPKKTIHAESLSYYTSPCLIFADLSIRHSDVVQVSICLMVKMSLTAQPSLLIATILRKLSAMSDSTTKVLAPYSSCPSRRLTPMILSTGRYPRILTCPSKSWTSLTPTSQFQVERLQDLHHCTYLCGVDMGQLLCRWSCICFGRNSH